MEHKQILRNGMIATMNNYVSLNNYTSYSIMRSINKPTDLIKRAVELDMSAIAITDYCTLSGIWEAYKVAKKIKLIVGCHLNFTDNRQPVFDFNSNLINKKPEIFRRAIILLAKNAVGYKNLLLINFEAEKCKLDKNSKIDRISLIDWDVLNKYHEGLICITGNAGGVVARYLIGSNYDRAKEEAIKLKNIFNDDFYFELQPNVYRDQDIDQFTANRGLYKLSQELDIACIAASNSFYQKKEDSDLHDFLMAMKYHRNYNDVNRYRTDKPNFYLHTEEEIIKFFQRNFGDDFAKKLCENSVNVANKCENPDWIKPEVVTNDKVQLPTFPVKDEECYNEFKVWVSNKPELSHLQEDQQYMRYWCEKEWNKIPNTEEYKKRYENELVIYEKLGFSSYMLITADFIRWARNNGIRTGPGRGCLAGNTLVLTNFGFKYLKDINVGEYVYTHTGNLKKVINKFSFDIPREEKLFSIKTTSSFEDIIMTKDHKVYGKKLELTDKYIYYDKINSELSKHVKKYKDDNYKIDWYKICDLNVGDYICGVTPNREIRSENVPKSFKIRLSSTHNSTFDSEKEIIIDNEFIYFLGRFVGDGWILHPKYGNKGRYVIGLAFNKNDVESINKFKNLFTTFGVHWKETISKDKDLVQLVFYNMDFANKLIEFFPDYNCSSATKHLPKFFRDLNDNQIIYLLYGIIDSDGSYDKKNKDKRLSVDSTSIRLIKEIREILLFVGINCSICSRKPFLRGKWLCKKCYKLRFDKRLLLENKCKFFQSKILKIEEISCDKVYDITVEDDSSYLTQNYAVHNSCGGSLVSFLLGIHNSDPIKYGLIFERFLNLEKKEFPDIDNDFDSNGRDKIIKYVTNKYGQDYVAHVSNFVTFTPKNAITDVITCLEIGGDRSEAFRIAKNITETIPTECKSIQSVIDNSPLFKEFSEQYPNIRKFSEMLIGLPRSYSTHAAGIIIGKYKLPGLVPLRYDDYDQVALEYEKTRTEENGLVKIDFLGLETLDIINETNKIIDNLNLPKPEDPPKYDEYYEDVYDLISSGDTACVFQLGTSAGTIELCKKIKPRDIEDLAVINALTRPGVPPDVRKSYIARKFGEEPVEIPHPNLKRAVRATMGYCIFEESFLFLAHDFCGWDLQKSDKMRKISKLKTKGKHLLAELHEDYMKGAIEHSKVSEEFAKKIWEEWIIPLSGYAFNKSHAVLYSMTSFHTAYLKAKYPGPFLTANLMSETRSNSPQAKDNIQRIKHEMRKLKIKIKQPDINDSDITYKLINENTLVTGFSALHGVKEPAAIDLIAKRPFKDFNDLIIRTDSTKVRSPVIQALAASGALDCFGLPRKFMYLYASDLRKRLKMWEKTSKTHEIDIPKDDWTKGEKRAMEAHYLGESFTGSKLDSYPTLFMNRGTSRIKNIQRMNEKERVIIELEVKGIFTFKVKNKNSKIVGQEIAKILAEDIYGDQINIVVFPDCLRNLYESYQNAFDTGDNPKLEKDFGLRIAATVNRYADEVSLVAQDIYGVFRPIAKPSDLSNKKIEIYKGLSKTNLDKIQMEDIVDDLFNLDDEENA